MAHHLPVFELDPSLQERRVGGDDREVKGCIVLPKRGIVERTFGWVSRARRLAKGFEALITSRPSQIWG
jgi:transposase